MHLKDGCSHVISEIQPQGSNQPRATSGKLKGTSVIKERLSLRVESMYFNLCVFMIELMKTVVCRKFGQQALFWIIWIVDIYIFLDMI